MSSFGRLAMLMLLGAVAVIGGGGVARAQTGGPANLDPRLGVERDRIAQTLAAAARDGLPVEILEDKVREGLAKNVPPPRITIAVTRLSEALTSARSELAGREKANARLYRAVVDAHSAGVSRVDVATVLASTSRADNNGSARALEVLGDLSRHGFPADSAARTVGNVARVKPDLLGHLVGEAEALRRSGMATPVEALDALARAAERSMRLDEASKLLPRGGRDRSAASDEHGPDRESQGAKGKKRGD